jgi:hypothetical protein
VHASRPCPKALFLLPSPSQDCDLSPPAGAGSSGSGAGADASGSSSSSSSVGGGSTSATAGWFHGAVALLRDAGRDQEVADAVREKLGEKDTYRQV